MKTYLRLALLFIVVAAVFIVIYTVKKAAAPESAIISAERNRMYAEQDKSRMQNDPIYAVEFQDRLQILDFRLALTYNSENKPDEAIAVLQRLISGEEAKGKSGPPRRSFSYFNEARYYGALKESFEIKHDEAAATKAAVRSDELKARAEQLKKIESSEEGKSVGLHGE